MTAQRGALVVFFTTDRIETLVYCHGGHQMARESVSVHMERGDGIVARSAHRFDLLKTGYVLMARGLGSQ